MKIIGIRDIYEDFVEVNVELEESDNRNVTGRELDGEDFKNTCYMVLANYTDEITNITGVRLHYIPMEGGLHEVGVIEKNSDDWKLIEKYIKTNKVK